MEKSEKNFLNYSHYIVTLTSVVYFIVKNFMQVEGEWGVESHPLEVHLQHFHILSVPFLFFAISLIFKGHILKKLRMKSKLLKRSGILLLSLALVMVFSGYGIQVAMDSFSRQILINTHLISSFLWVVIFFYHSFMAKKRT